jgi:hypothetical protein
LWRRPRPKLGCGAKERRKKKEIKVRLTRKKETYERKTERNERRKGKEKSEGNDEGKRVHIYDTRVYPKVSGLGR